jgi:hypothetical protein
MPNRLTTPPSGLRRTLALVIVVGAIGCAGVGDEAPTAPAALSRAPRPAHGTADQTSGVLLACPTRSEVRAAAWIGPAGGSVEARGATLTVPAGAVAVTTRFEVVVPVSQTMVVDVHAVGVDAFRFRTPATITLNFGRCDGSGVPFDRLQGANVDLATGAILELMGGVVDQSGHKLSFATPHLSGYAVAY